MDWITYEDTASDQVKGQLSFFEEKKVEQVKEEPTKQYAYSCGGCICNKCANDVYGSGIPEEMIEPCYVCEDCRNYDGDVTKSYNNKTECPSFCITKRASDMNRRRICMHSGGKEQR